MSWISSNFIHPLILKQHMYQIEIKSLIAEYISESRSPVIPIRNLKVDLLDMDYSKENKLVLLVSYSVRTSEWKFFMLFTLSMPGSPAGVNGIGGGGGLQIADCRPLSYRTTVGGGGVGSGTPPSSQYQSSSLPWSHGGGLARLALSNGGPTAFVFFPDAIVITSHISDIGFEDTLPIADALTDRVIGFGCVSSSSSTSSIHSAFEVDGIASAAVCCWSSGIIGLDVNVKAFIGKSQRQHVSDKERVDEQLYIKLEQAVLFASDRVQKKIVTSRQFCVEIELFFNCFSLCLILWRLI